MKLLILTCLLGLTFAAAVVETTCNKMTSDSKVQTACTTTADSQTPAKKCCLATFSTLTTWKNGADTSTKGTQIAVVASAKGGSYATGGKVYACYQSGGEFRFKTGAATVSAKEGWASAATFCATAAVNKAQSNKDYTHTFGTNTAITGKDFVSGTSHGLGFTGTANICACGVKAANPCEQLASNKVEKDCVKTDDAASGTKAKCCLATFDTVPTTKNSGTARAVTAGETGSVINTKFFACYKKSGGSILFTTASNADTDKS